MARILVVDDDADVRFFLKACLEMEGHSVQLATHGGEALRLMNEACLPQLIITDLSMPFMDGRTFLKKKNETGKCYPSLRSNVLPIFPVAQGGVRLGADLTHSSQPALWTVPPRMNQSPGVSGSS